MKRKFNFIFYFLCLVAIILVSGCSYKENSSDKSSNNNKLTLDQIKQSYSKTEEKVLNTQEYENYVLVENQAPTLANHFTLYDLKTGNKDILPSGTDFIDYAELIDKNNIILYSKGTNSESELQVFPFKIVCTRSSENNNSDEDFIPIYKELNLPVDKQMTIKGKDKEEINSIRITVNGLQVCFSPQSSSDESFNADYVDIPTLDISYDKTKEEFSLKFHDTIFAKSFSKTSPLSYSNTYIKSLNLKSSGNLAIITMKLNDTAKYFIGKKDNINGIPYMDIQFTEKSDD